MADMELNAAIARTMEYLESRKFSGGLRKGEMDLLFELQEALDKPLQGILDKILPARQSPPLPNEIPSDATRDDLAKTISEMAWRAFEIAEDMQVSNALLRRDLRAGAYRRMVREICEIGRVTVRENVRDESEAIPF